MSANSLEDTRLVTPSREHDNVDVEDPGGEIGQRDVVAEFSDPRSSGEELGAISEQGLCDHDEES